MALDASAQKNRAMPEQMIRKKNALLFVHGFHL
jgi:hypothetical protein